MKIYLSHISSLSFLLGLLSCGSNTEKVGKSLNFSLEIIDSVQVDFLGDLKLIDYDSKEDKYLLTTRYPEEYLEVDNAGEILIHKKFTPDGLDAVNAILGIGYLDGEVTVLSDTKGYLMYRDGIRTDEINLPYTYIPYMNYPKLGAFRYENRLFYPKPMRGALFTESKGGGALFAAIYNMPIIESLDLTTKDTISSVRLPKTSGILAGQFHGMIFPVFTETENHVLYSTSVEPVIYVYKKLNGEIVYDRTVQIEIPDWVANTPTDLEDQEEFYRLNNKIRNGALTDFLQVGDYYLAIYNKGIEESKMPEQIEDQDKFNLAIQMKNPFYAAIFDKEFNQLAVNVLFPTTSAAPRVVNSKGDLVVSKDASLSETEDDGIILYRIKLKVE